ncbi:hypothetical protein HMPREF3152_07920 [Actinomyces sp. HMSC06A08]|nr:hypothetical protein HMPREF3152_07920 [Actinomyces sp. HMSC06A08]
MAVNTKDYATNSKPKSNKAKQSVQDATNQSKQAKLSILDTKTIAAFTTDLNMLIAIVPQAEQTEQDKPTNDNEHDKETKVFHFVYSFVVRTRKQFLQSRIFTPDSDHHPPQGGGPKNR